MRRCARTSASCRLSDGMSTSSSVRSARRCARGSTRRAYRHTLGITRRSDTPAGLEPEKGLLLAVLPKGADTEDELGELRELDPHRARGAGRRAHPAASAGRSEDLRRQGEARGAEGALRGLQGRRADRRRRARPDPAAGARGCPLDARRRPHPADPRHLRPARRQRRGQAPGRARTAGVQPAAHARHVEAPRAPRRRRRHARPGRVAARERPPDGAPPHHAAAGAAEGAPGPARRRGARSASAPRCRRSRSPGTRTSASRRS